MSFRRLQTIFTPPAGQSYDDYWFYDDFNRANGVFAEGSPSIIATDGNVYGNSAPWDVGPYNNFKIQDKTLQAVNLNNFVVIPKTDTITNQYSYTFKVIFTMPDATTRFHFQCGMTASNTYNYIEYQFTNNGSTITVKRISVVNSNYYPATTFITAGKITDNVFEITTPLTSGAVGRVKVNGGSKNLLENDFPFPHSFRTYYTGTPPVFKLFAWKKVT